MERPKIDYPCEWPYQIIGSEEHALKQAVAEILGNNKYELSVSNKSSGGKYIALYVTTIVASEEHRNRIFAFLGAHPSVKIVF